MSYFELKSAKLRINAARIAMKKAIEDLQASQGFSDELAKMRSLLVDVQRVHCKIEAKIEKLDKQRRPDAEM